MASFGYLVYMIRASEPGRPMALQQLDSIAGEGLPPADLLTVLQQTIQDYGPGYHSIADRSEGFRVREVRLEGRSLWLKINRGPEGNPGETYNRETEESVDTDERISLLSGLRAGFYIPRGSYFGLLFVERVGGRHLKDLLDTFFVREVRDHLATAIRLESFAELQDWESVLARQQVFRVSEMLHSRTSGDDPSTPDDYIIRVAAEGSGLRRFSDAIRGLIEEKLRRREHEFDLVSEIAPLERRRSTVRDVHTRTGATVRRRVRAGQDAFTIQDEAEYQRILAEIKATRQSPARGDLNDELAVVTPVDRNRFESDRFEVALGEDRPERTFVIESDAVPQFVYELDGRVVDRPLQQTWDAHAEAILRNRGVTLPRTWLMNVAPPPPS